MSETESKARSSAVVRRHVVVRRAVTVFARTGYWATPVAEVAADAQISPAYVFRLFDSKLGLFVAAIDSCFDDVVDTLEQAADEASGAEPEEVLTRMGDAYAHLIADRSLLMLQVHALSATDVPEIAEALQRGAARVVTVARERSGASAPAVQRFVAYGQLCHLIAAAGLEGIDASWARCLTDGMAHPERPEVVA